MPKHTEISSILNQPQIGEEMTVQGWVRAFRANRFIALNDGSTIKNLQIVIDYENLAQDLLKKITTGAAIKATGKFVESQGRGQAVEIKANHIVVYGEADPEVYPLQPKRHSLEFLREIEDYYNFKAEVFCW